jgi:LAS superfamily LD-carboxypeptidase LdcB
MNTLTGYYFNKNNLHYTKNLNLLSISKNIEIFIGSENLKKIKELDPLMQQKVIKLYELCKEQGYYFNISSGKRTYQQQKELYDKYAHIYGTDKTGIPGNSEHELGVAIDIKIGETLSYSPKYDEIARIWKTLGGYWGKDDIDEYWHLEIRKEKNAQK